MHRIACVLAAAAALILAVAAPATAAPPRDALRGFQCQQALEPAERAVSVTSVMRPVSRTQAMAVRFELRSRAKGAAGYTPVTGTDLGRWISPTDRTLGRRAGDVWILKKPVVDLPAPAAYRFRVSFRWTGARHRVLATAVKTSSTCLQPELRPDLAVLHVGVPQPNRKGTADFYTVTVANNGATAAGPFAIQLAAPSGSPVLAAVGGLAAHGQTTRTIRGPLCSAGAPTVTVDPAGQVEDFDRANNVLRVDCTSPVSNG